MPKKTPGEKRRLNLKLDSELAEWVFEYALLRNTSVTKLITGFIENLRQQHEEQLNEDAEQI